jgi:hypothetical protein
MRIMRTTSWGGTRTTKIWMILPTETLGGDDDDDDHDGNDTVEFKNAEKERLCKENWTKPIWNVNGCKGET